MKLLSIGNSFSQDAQRYLAEIAASAGEEITAYNLYIGGCSLEQHWENAWHDAASYDYELNGEAVGKSSILQALKAEAWDVITLQQVSQLAGVYESYMPFLPRLVSLCREICPHAKLYLHQTWAYEVDTTHGGFATYHHNQAEMHAAVRAAARRAANLIEADVLPVGDVIAALRNTPTFDYVNGGRTLCRDGFHLTLDYGRYAAALTWFARLTGKSPAAVTFVPQGCDTALLCEIQHAVETVVGE